MLPNPPAYQHIFHRRSIYPNVSAGHINLHEPYLHESQRHIRNSESVDPRGEGRCRAERETTDSGRPREQRHYRIQARPRNISGDEEDDFADYKALLVDPERPPWGRVEHPGWSSPSSHDLPDLPYRAVMQELPHLIEAKAVSLAPPDQLDPHGHGFEHPVPDTQVVGVLQRSASMGLRAYIQHLTSFGLINPPELGDEFLSIYELARFSSRDLYEAEFRHLMHLFASILRGMKSLSPEMIEEARGGFSRADTESVIGPSDEEGETSSTDYSESPLTRSRRESLQQSNAPSIRSLQTPVSSHGNIPHRRQDAARTPSVRSLRHRESNASWSSHGSIIHFTGGHGPSDLPYIIDDGGRSIRSVKSVGLVRSNRSNRS